MFFVLIINNTIHLYSASCASQHKVTKRVQRVMDLFKQFSLLRVMNLMFQCELRENNKKKESFFSRSPRCVISNVSSCTVYDYKNKTRKGG